MRYVTSDPAANGETDFMGETRYFDTDQRVEFLRHYADYASEYFDVPGFNTVAAPDSQVEEIMQKLKPQPQPEIRKRLPLDEWKWLGYRDGQREEQIDRLQRWKEDDKYTIDKGYLAFVDEADADFRFRQQGLRYTATWEIWLDSSGQRGQSGFLGQREGNSLANRD